MGGKDAVVDVVVGATGVDVDSSGGAAVVASGGAVVAGGGVVVENASVVVVMSDETDEHAPVTSARTTSN